MTSKNIATGDCFFQPGHILNEVGELTRHRMDQNHVDTVMKAVILKSNKSHGFIRERGDPIKGVWYYSREQTFAEPW